MVQSSSETEIRERYDKAGQGHVFKYFDSLSDDEKSTLLQQLDEIKVEDLDGLVSAAKATDSKEKEEEAPITPFSGCIGYSATDPTIVDGTAWDTGLQAIANGEVAALVLAGGQGTRLGFDGPKGMYNIGLPSNRSLFQLIVERIRKLCELAQEKLKNEQAAEPKAKQAKLNGDDDVKAANGTADSSSSCVLPFYIMTSPLNHDATVSYFKENDYFGMKEDDIFFFKQGMLPCFTMDDDNKIIMESASKVAMAPDGNGGIYPSLQNSGALDDMTKKRNVKYLHVFSIDNALVKPADPVFVGYCIQNNADCGNKSVWKTNAHEKVGVVAEKNGKPCIVEYSEITTEMAERTNSDNGKLMFGAGNICNHYYTIDFIQQQILPNIGNLYHIAKKKIPYYNEEMKQTEKPSDTNNGIKLESFIFDVFPLSTKMTVLDVKREEEFAPVKNATTASKTDNPETAKAAISELAKSWVQKAGGKLLLNVDDDDGNGTTTTCEVAPLTSYAGEGLESLVKDKEIKCPFSL